MKNILIMGLLAIFAGGAAAAPAPAADKAAADKAAAAEAAREEAAKVGVIKVYNISDLLWARKDYPFESAISMPPTMPPTRTEIMNLSRGRGAAGAGGGGGGAREGGGAGGVGAGGAAAANLDQQEQLARNVVDLLVETVEPHSWVQNGGPFTVKFLGGLLIINQNKENHDLIAQLLGQLRAEGSRLVTVKAHWVLLGPAELEGLVGKRDEKKSSGAQEIDAAALGKLGEKALHYRAQTSCFNGQTVHIASGRGRTAVMDLEAVTGDGTSLYNPIPKIVQSGAMLQVTPMLSQDGKEAVVDVQSVISEWDAPPPPAEIRTPTTRPTSEMLDRINVLVQQLRTTVQVPVGRPVLVGGMTLEPTTKGANSGQMYLIIEVVGGN